MSQMLSKGMVTRKNYCFCHVCMCCASHFRRAGAKICHKKRSNRRAEQKFWQKDQARNSAT